MVSNIMITSQLGNMLLLWVYVCLLVFSFFLSLFLCFKILGDAWLNRSQILQFVSFGSKVFGWRFRLEGSIKMNIVTSHSFYVRTTWWPISSSFICQIETKLHDEFHSFWIFFHKFWCKWNAFWQILHSNFIFHVDIHMLFLDFLFIPILRCIIFSSSQLK